jgi:hypothetical protein
MTETDFRFGAMAREARPRRPHLGFPTKSKKDPVAALGRAEAFWASSPVGRAHGLHLDRTLRERTDRLRVFLPAPTTELPIKRARGGARHHFK